jgi:hypothetical protein
LPAEKRPAGPQLPLIPAIGAATDGVEFSENQNGWP